MASKPERRQLANGSAGWRVVWREDGAKQTEHFPDEPSAIEFRRLVEAHGNKWPRGWTKGHGYAEAPGAVVTFKRWAERAIAARSRASVRTRNDYARDLARHVYPTLGHIAIDRLTFEDVGRWHTHLIDLGLSAKTVQNLHGMVSSIVNDATRQNPPLITHNPFMGRLESLPDVRVEEMTFLLPVEFAAILEHVRVFYQPLVVTLAGTGLRWGEATALRVRDVDLDRRRLTVVQAWKSQGDNTWRLGPPKTARSRRTIALSADVVGVLRPLLAGRRGDELVFLTVTGRPIRTAPFYTNVWAPAVARARVCARHLAGQGDSSRHAFQPAPCACPGVLDKKPRVHDLRHTHASWLIAAGVNLMAIQRRLGHSSITTTIDRYGHLAPEADDPILDALDAALGGQTAARDVA